MTNDDDSRSISHATAERVVDGLAHRLGAAPVEARLRQELAGDVVQWCASRRHVALQVERRVNDELLQQAMQDSERAETAERRVRALRQKLVEAERRCEALHRENEELRKQLTM